MTTQSVDEMREILRTIAKLVRTPTRDTPHRTANDHFQSDFDLIRKLTEDYK